MVSTHWFQSYPLFLSNLVSKWRIGYALAIAHYDSVVSFIVLKFSRISENLLGAQLLSSGTVGTPLGLKPSRTRSRHSEEERITNNSYGRHGWYNIHSTYTTNYYSIFHIYIYILYHHVNRIFINPLLGTVFGWFWLAIQLMLVANYPRDSFLWVTKPQLISGLSLQKKTMYPLVI
jgi:hypothetical protein